MRVSSWAHRAWAWALSVPLYASKSVYVGAIFPIPDQGLKVFCTDLDCVSESLAALKTYYNDPIVIGMLSYR
jgi:hypothetical protein